MIYLQLFLSYLKIGFFGFGGGYAMLSLIQHEVVISHQWISNSELTDIIAISQMTPGPIASSAATFVVVTVAEVLLAVAIIMGIWVRMSALILSLGILLMFAWGGFGAGELEFVWLGVYVFLIISGGGLYAFDTALTPAKPKK